MNRVRKARRRRPLMSPVLFAPLILLIGLVAMPNPEDATFPPTPTNSSQHRLDLIAFRTRQQVKLDYSGYHHWPNPWSESQRAGQ